MKKLKNTSVRTRILAVVVIVNVLGACVLSVYLHQSYSAGLDLTIEATGIEGVAAWEELAGPEGIDPINEPVRAHEILLSMNAITGAEYGVLLYKEAVDEPGYSAARDALGEPSVWAEREAYALLAATDEGAAEEMQFVLPPTEVPENSRLIGVEVGACTQTCHDGVTGEGDYWVVRWSPDRSTRGHAVFPIYNQANEPVGIVYAIEDISEQADAANRSMLQTLFAVAATLLAAMLTIGMITDLLVLKRLARMTKHIQDISLRIAGGDFSAHFEPDGTEDEIGSFEKFYSEFVSLISVTLKAMSGQK